jgi:ethanolaminephosphotransferase
MTFKLTKYFPPGVDALNTTLEVLLFVSVMNFGQSWSTVLTLFGCLLTFYIQTWEEHHTKTLYLGIVSGPVEGVLTLCVVFLVTAVKGGGHIWEQSVFRTLGIGREMLGWVPDEVYEMPWNKSFLVYGGIILGGSVVMRFVLFFTLFVLCARKGGFLLIEEE